MQNIDEFISQKTLLDDRWLVLYKADVSVRYHRHRQRFFDLADKLTKAATVLLGAAIMGGVLKDAQPILATFISSLGLLALVFGYGDRKQAHKELAEAFSTLIKDIESCQINELGACDISQWKAHAAALDAKEPPSLQALVTLCESEASTAAGYPNHIKLPSWPRRLIADFY